MIRAWYNPGKNVGYFQAFEMVAGPSPKKVKFDYMMI
jgi:hypothetical protein